MSSWLLLQFYTDSLTVDGTRLLTVDALDSKKYECCPALSSFTLKYCIWASRIFLYKYFIKYELQYMFENINFISF